MLYLIADDPDAFGVPSTGSETVKVCHEECNEPRWGGRRRCRQHHAEHRRRLELANAPKCAALGCPRPAETKGRCQRHYKRLLWRRMKEIQLREKEAREKRR